MQEILRNNSQELLLVFDNCGFGANADDLFKEMKLRKNIHIIGYECEGDIYE